MKITRASGKIRSVRGEDKVMDCDKTRWSCRNRISRYQRKTRARGKEDILAGDRKACMIATVLIEICL